MGVIHWFNSYTHDTQFTVEFDDSDVSSEFSELVYGLIENADGMAYRRDETIASQRLTIDQLRQEALTLTLELKDYKDEYVPPENRRNGVSIADYIDGAKLASTVKTVNDMTDSEFNDMCDGVYIKGEITIE